MKNHSALVLVVPLAFGILLTTPARAGSNHVSVRSYVVQGDTQNWAYAPLTAGEWEQVQRELCRSGASRILGTGDIIDDRDDAAQWARADRAYDITDACGLEATLPAGNHDLENFGITDFRPYDAFMRGRRLHAPLAESASGRAWVDRLEPGHVVGVLPWLAAGADVDWLERWLANNPQERAILIQHEAAEPVSRRLSSAVSRLVSRFGSRIIGVIGGHYVPGDRVVTWSHGATWVLFTNFQLGAVLGERPEGLVTMLHHYMSSDTWCIRTVNVLTGESGRFESSRCL
jgi:hypothetical protein